MRRTKSQCFKETFCAVCDRRLEDSECYVQLRKSCIHDDSRLFFTKKDAIMRGARTANSGEGRRKRLRHIEKVHGLQSWTPGVRTADVANEYRRKKRRRFNC